MAKEWRSNAQGMQRELITGMIWPICNFQARVTAMRIDMGDEVEYRLETRYRRSRQQIRLDPEELDSLQWVATLGKDAKVCPGQAYILREGVLSQGDLRHSSPRNRGFGCDSFWRCANNQTLWFKAGYWLADFGYTVPSKEVRWIQLDPLRVDDFLLTSALTRKLGSQRRHGLTTAPSLRCCRGISIADGRSKA